MDDEFGKPRLSLARNAARNLLKQAKIENYPIKLKDIAKHVDDLFIDGEELENEISGMQGTYKGASFIRYNTTHSTTRNRFTVAHELGHAILGHTSGCERGLLSSKNSLEIEANQFAAELLVPLDILKKAVRSIKNVDQLAKAFWISNDSMSWRVLETGVYKQLNSWNRV